MKTKLSTLSLAVGMGLMAFATPVVAGKEDNSLNIALKLENYNMTRILRPTGLALS